MLKIVWLTMLFGFTVASIHAAEFSSEDSRVKYPVLSKQFTLSDTKKQWALIPFESLSLEKGGCYGKCPVMKVTFYRGGKAVYDGKFFTTLKGQYSGKIGLYNFALLSSFIERTHIMRLSESYRAAWTDDATITLRIKSATGEKVIEDYGRQAPAEFQALVALFEKITRNIRWIKAK